MTSSVKPDPHTPRLKPAMAEAGSLHEVSDLERNGIRKVCVLSTSRLQELMRVAVNRALRSSLDELQLPSEALQKVSLRAEVEYERLVKAGLESPGPPPAPRDAPSGLREFLNREEENLRGLAHGIPDASNMSYDISPKSDEFRAFEDRMVQNLSTLLEKDWRSELDRVQSSHRKQLSLLERRISKLVRALESTDRVLAHVQTGRGDAAAGGDGELEPVSPLTEKKSQLLAALFQTNLELRELQKDDE